MNNDPFSSESVLDYESLTEPQLREALYLKEDLVHREHMKVCREDFIEFCKYMDPNFMVGNHHKIMGQAFNKIVHENNKRIIINMPPRHGKSYLTSQYLPAFFIGNYPKAQLMNIANVAELAVKFGRQVKDVIGSDKFKDVFPGIEVRSDSKSAGRWQINQGGESFSLLVVVQIYSLLMTRSLNRASLSLKYLMMYGNTT